MNINIHPKGTNAKILLSSVFGPYARDDEYGSRKINPMELHHNQVTKVQGPFSLRAFHPTFGLRFIAANLNAPITILDFPTLNRFIDEIKNNKYDIIGIGSIMTNVYKVKKMCELIRKYQPDAVIVVGGTIFNLPGVEKIIDTDYIVKGDGVRWFRNFLGQDENDAIRHPAVQSGFGTRILGINVRQTKDNTGATIAPTLGCPMGCNFCLTSAMFGGKGKSIQFFKTGKELFNVMCDIEKKLNTNSFFILDENFLFYKKRALGLLELMEKHNKSWTILPFSSAQVLNSYSIEQLVGLGINWVWIGLEGKKSKYAKLSGINTREMVKRFQTHGIRVLGSTIIGLEHHTPDNINDVIEWAVSHNTDLHQFMLYTAVPGTPLYRQLLAEGRILSNEELPIPDFHGQYKFNYRHEHIKNGEETKLLLQAFNRDFEINGPSIVRLIRTELNGWKRYKNHPNPRIRRRFHVDCKNLKLNYAGVVWAAKKWYRKDKRMHSIISKILDDLYNEFGLKTKLAAPVIGRYLYYHMKKEDERLKNGWSYEPTTLYEKNAKALAIEKNS